MKKSLLAAGAALALLVSAGAASAHGRHDHGRYYDGDRGYASERAYQDRAYQDAAQTQLLLGLFGVAVQALQSAQQPYAQGYNGYADDDGYYPQQYRARPYGYGYGQPAPRAGLNFNFGR